MEIPTWKEYEDKCGHPVTAGEYWRYLKINFKEKMEEIENE